MLGGAPRRRVSLDPCSKWSDLGGGEADSAQRFSPLEMLCSGTVCSSVVEMKVANGCGVPWLQPSLAKLSRSVLNSFCGPGRPPQNCNPPASASQGIVPPDLASWLFIKTWIQSPLCPAVTVTCVSTQGERTFPSREQPWRGEGGQDRGCEQRDAASSAGTVCAMQSEAGGVWGLLTFGWLAISRGQEL